MVYNRVIHGRFVDLRSITMEDAQFSYSIRMDEKNKDVVGQVASSVEEQRKFIEWQMLQPGDYYFVVLNKQGERIGLIGVYDIHDGIGEVGREVNCGSPVESMEAEVLLNQFIKEELKLERYCSVVYAHNKRQLSLIRKCGYEIEREIERNGIPSYYFEYKTQIDYMKKTKKLLEKITFTI